MKTSMKPQVSMVVAQKGTGMTRIALMTLGLRAQATRQAQRAIRS